MKARTAMLASVTSLAEARIAVAAGADIIDLKNPQAGALGALPLQLVKQIVARLEQSQKVSATVGDLLLDEPVLIHRQVAAMTATGVTFVKLGWFAGDRQQACLEALQPLCATDTRLVIVMFADQQPDFSWLALFAECACAGVMLDTADKSRGGLRDSLSADKLQEFINTAHELGLLAGLAGSLRAGDIAPLLALRPDYLGFRGALCEQNSRTAGLNQSAITRVRALMQ